MTPAHDILDTELLARLSDLLSRATGLHFPPPRWPELHRGISAVAGELGFHDFTQCAYALLSAPLTPAQINALAANLTISETYFFRDDGLFDALANHILPSLTRKRRDSGNRLLRIWSAACCTGEEPYSVAILLHELLPDLNDWNLTLLATDINPRALRAAEVGIFGKWSFRNTPDRLKQRYFRPMPDGRFEAIPEIKRLVRFAQLNLAQDIYPSLSNDAAAMDIIFCRNVLIYFDAPQARRVIEHLHRAQADGGWLIVSPAELPHVSAAPYTMVNRPGAILCHKTTPHQDVIPISQLADQSPQPVADVAPPDPPADDSTTQPGDCVQSLADQGELVKALVRCDHWIAADKLDAIAHYLRAVILQEQGVITEASRSLRRSLYLDPNLVMAHFALAQIARTRGLIHEADKHLGNARRLSGRFNDDEILPQSGGITAGRFAEMISRMTTLKKAA